MNSDLRNRIAAIVKEVSILEGQLAALRDNIEEIRAEEQKYLDAMPERLQYGEKGDLAQQAISYLEEALSPLEKLAHSVVSSLEAASQ